MWGNQSTLAISWRMQTRPGSNLACDPTVLTVTPPSYPNKAICLLLVLVWAFCWTPPEIFGHKLTPSSGGTQVKAGAMLPSTAQCCPHIDEQLCTIWTGLCGHIQSQQRGCRVLWHLSHWSFTCRCWECVSRDRGMYRNWEVKRELGKWEQCFVLKYKVLVDLLCVVELSLVLYSSAGAAIELSSSLLGDRKCITSGYIMFKSASNRG